MIHFLKLACVLSSLFRLYYALVIYEIQGFKGGKTKFIREFSIYFLTLLRTEFNLGTWPLGQPGPEPERHQDGMDAVCKFFDVSP